MDQNFQAHFPWLQLLYFVTFGKVIACLYTSVSNTVDNDTQCSIKKKVLMLTVEIEMWSTASTSATSFPVFKTNIFVVN